MIDDKLVHEALQRYARSPDGRVFYIGLQKVLMGVPSDSEPGALRENLGRRRFASELMAVMAEAMTENSGDGSGGDGIGSGERPIIFQLRGPAVVAGQRGAKRRVAGPADQSE